VFSPELLVQFLREVCLHLFPKLALKSHSST
jgi:hypothetical protein